MYPKPDHRALRAGRRSQIKGIHLVTFAIASRRRIFLDFPLAYAACRTFAPTTAAAWGTLLCWVRMPDHFHALVRLDGEVSRSAVVQRLKSVSARACCNVQPDAEVWARAFHGHALRRDEDLPGRRVTSSVTRYVRDWCGRSEITCSGMRCGFERAQGTLLK
jgi:REP element-mobilizing transposase RayT